MDSPELCTSRIGTSVYFVELENRTGNLESSLLACHFLNKAKFSATQERFTQFCLSGMVSASATSAGRFLALVSDKVPWIASQDPSVSSDYIL